MSSDDFDFSTHQFSSPQRPDRWWLEWFRDELARHIMNIDIDFETEAPFFLHGKTRALRDLSIYRGQCSPARARNLVQSEAEDPALLVGMRGAMSITVEGKSFELPAGTAVLVRHQDASVLQTHSTTEVLAIRLRRRLLEPLAPNLDDRAGELIPAGSQAMQLLLGYLRLLDSQNRIESPEARHLVTTHVHDLAALACGVTADAGGVIAERGKRAARLATIKNDILDNLSSSRLSIGSVAARHGITPRYVHMLFEDEGTTFGEFVLAQRLTRAYRMLCDPRYSHLTIHSIALQTGFGDLSYFNRTFRRRFAMTPSEVRMAGPTPPP